MNPEATIHDYAITQVNQLLTTLAYNLHRATRVHDADSVHDLRVSVRRFVAGLRTFREFFPADRVKDIRGELKQLMDVASEIRNRDIAAEFLAEQSAGSDPKAGEIRHTLTQRLAQQRRTLEQEFAVQLQRWNASDFSAKWRSALGLRSQ